MNSERIGCRWRCTLIGSKGIRSQGFLDTDFIDMDHFEWFRLKKCGDGDLIRWCVSDSSDYLSECAQSVFSATTR